MKRRIIVMFVVVGDINTAKDVWKVVKYNENVRKYTISELIRIREEDNVCEVLFNIQSSDDSYFKMYSNISSLMDIAFDTYDNCVVAESLRLKTGMIPVEISAMDVTQLGEYIHDSDAIFSAEIRKRDISLSRLWRDVDHLKKKIDYMATSISTSGCINSMHFINELNNKLADNNLPNIEIPKRSH